MIIPPTLIAILLLGAAATIIYLAVHVRALRNELETMRVKRGHLLSSLSHELRTPLNAVLGYGNLLRQSKLENDQHDMVEASIDAGNHLLELIDSFLFGLGAKSKDQILADRKPFFPAQLLNELIKMQGPLARDKQLAIAVNTEFDKETELFGNPILFRGALRVLFQNAVEYTHEGHISILLSLRSDANGGCMLEACVADTGPNMSQERRAILENSFHMTQAGNATKKGEIELGLPLIAGIINVTGGYVRIDDGTDIGSSYRIGLPVEIRGAPTVFQSDIPEHVHIQTTSEPPFSRRVLIVDDNQTNRNILSNIMKKSGYNVALAVDGLDALELLQSSHFDIVLLDVNMPRMTGTEMCRHWRQIEDSKTHLPIIGITADATSETRHECLESGMDEYLTKPVDAVILNRVMEQLFHRLSRGIITNNNAHASKAVPANDIAPDVISTPIIMTAQEGPDLEIDSLSEKNITAIDDDQIAYLLSIGDADFMEEMIVGFFEDIGDILPTLRAASAQGDTGKFRLGAHALKSASNNLGALSLAKLCHEFETIDEVAFTAEPTFYLSQLENGIEAASIELTAMRESLPNLVQHKQAV